MRTKSPNKVTDYLTTNNHPLSHLIRGEILKCVRNYPHLLSDITQSSECFISRQVGQHSMLLQSASVKVEK